MKHAEYTLYILIYTIDHTVCESPAINDDRTTCVNVGIGIVSGPFKSNGSSTVLSITSEKKENNPTNILPF